MPHSPKHNVLLKVLAMIKAIFFSKKALHAGTARNNWQKYALPGKVFICNSSVTHLLGQELLRDCLRDQLQNSPSQPIILCDCNVII